MERPVFCGALSLCRVSTASSAVSSVIVTSLLLVLVSVVSRLALGFVAVAHRLCCLVSRLVFLCATPLVFESEYVLELRDKVTKSANLASSAYRV